MFIRHTGAFTLQATTSVPFGYTGTDSRSRQATAFDWQDPFVSLIYHPFSPREVSQNDDTVERFVDYLIQNQDRIQIRKSWYANPSYGKTAQRAIFILDNVEFFLTKRPSSLTDPTLPWQYIFTIYRDEHDETVTCKRVDGIPEIKIGLAPIYSTPRQRSAAQSFSQSGGDGLPERSTRIAQKLDRFLRETLDSRLDTRLTDADLHELTDFK